jgi:hypothetical protein
MKIFIYFIRNGNLGTGDYYSLIVPTTSKYLMGKKFISISSGHLGFHVCSITENFQGICWGYNG